MIYTGCRLGEVMALTWDDIDFAAKRIRIARSADAKTRKIQEPKSKRAKRNVPLDPQLAKGLRGYRTRQEKGMVPALGAWLFPTTRPDHEQGAFVLDQRSYVQRHLDPVRKAGCDSARPSSFTSAASISTRCFHLQSTRKPEAPKNLLIPWRLNHRGSLRDGASFGSKGTSARLTPPRQRRFIAVKSLCCYQSSSPSRAALNSQQQDSDGRPIDPSDSNVPAA